MHICTEVSASSPVLSGAYELSEDCHPYEMKGPIAHSAKKTGRRESRTETCLSP